MDIANASKDIADYANEMKVRAVEQGAQGVAVTAEGTTSLVTEICGIYNLPIFY